jgi:S-adenosylmethionine/arginine decarboxylase-like enzyme
MDRVFYKHMLLKAELPKFFTEAEETDFELWQHELILKLDMKLMAGPMNVYVPRVGLRGWCGVSLIETSSVTFHVWDEKDTIVVHGDVFTCGELDSEIVIDHFREFGSYKIKYLVLDRENGFDVLEAGTKVYDSHSEV